VTPTLSGKGSVEAMEAAVKKGVVIASIDAYDLMFYKNGVFDAKCSSSINHMVVIVGFGVTNESDGDDVEHGVEYWIVKNSWGSDWGEDGYIKIRKRGKNEPKDGFCGIYVRSYIPYLN
jgi:C1A family cysteine protease